MQRCAAAASPRTPAVAATLTARAARLTEKQLLRSWGMAVQPQHAAHFDFENLHRDAN